MKKCVNCGAEANSAVSDMHTMVSLPCCDKCRDYVLAVTPEGKMLETELDLTSYNADPTTAINETLRICKHMPFGKCDREAKKHLRTIYRSTLLIKKLVSKKTSATDIFSEVKGLGRALIAYGKLISCAERKNNSSTIRTAAELVPWLTIIELSLTPSPFQRAGISIDSIGEDRKLILSWLNNV